MKPSLKLPALSEYRRDALAWLVYALVMVATIAVWKFLDSIRFTEAEKRFGEVAVVQRDALINRMKDYEQVLLGASGLFAASEVVSREEWRDYVNSLRLHQTLPGIEGVGYTVMVPAARKAAHEAQMRANGYPNYAIFPTGERELYSSIIYLEPFSGRNLRAFAFDMYSDPVRRRAMQRAADTGEPAWSDKVTLVQEDAQAKPQAGFLVYVAIYAKDKPLRTIDERRAALLGFVYSPFRAGDLMRQLYQFANRQFEVQIYDGVPEPERLLYQTTESSPAAFFGIDLPVDIGGTRWMARFTSNPKFNAEVFSDLPAILLLVTLALESLFFLSFALDSRHRRKLLLSSRELAQSNREVHLLASLTQLLQNCNHEEEAFPVIGSILGELFPGSSGCCYLLGASERMLCRVAGWGEQVTTARECFTPEDCWAYRRGQVHGLGARQQGAEVRCAHVQPWVGAYVCAPMLAQGKVIGDLYLERGEPEKSDERFAHYADLLSSAADTISLSLSNLRLRNSLRDLATRDALTGLFNRRYMEESLQRELDQAQRHQHSFAVVMLDVDHFKPLNDTYGHDAGDLMLKRIADQLVHFGRRGFDVACRYGGEEFILIVTEITRKVLNERLEGLRLEIEAQRVSFAGKDLPKTTISMGVAFFPDDAGSAADLVSKADQALYRAKQNGRNRIEWCVRDGDQPG